MEFSEKNKTRAMTSKMHLALFSLASNLFQKDNLGYVNSGMRSNLLD